MVNLSSSAVKTNVVLLAALAVAGCSKFNDPPGMHEEGFGRTVNGISALVAGAVSQQIATNGSFTMTIQKPGWSDAQVKGIISPTQIDSEVDLALSTSSFKASGTAGALEGALDKSEFNWKIVQQDATTWKIERFGFKLDTELKISAQNGVISGIYDRPFPDNNWNFSGTYTPQGDVVINVSTGITEPSFTIVGKVNTNVSTMR